MTAVRIYRPTKTAMQSGRAKTRRWLLEFELGSPKFIEPLMGWVGSADTRRQLRLWFDSREEAVAYAERNDLSYRVEEAHERRITPKNYADNFRPPAID